MNIVIPIYNPNEDAMRQHFNIWEELSKYLGNNLKIVIVDDASSLPYLPELEFNVNLKIIRIYEDILWNVSGALNLGMHVVEDDWTLILNEDHIIKPDQFMKIFDLNLEAKNNFYMFDRIRPNGQSRNKNTQALCLIHKSSYWKGGGYDEDFVGKKGCSDWFFMGRYPRKENSLLQTAGITAIQTDIKIIETQSFSNMSRTNAINKGMNYSLYANKLKQLNENTYKHTPILRFNWKIAKEIIYENT